MGNGKPSILSIVFRRFREQSCPHCRYECWQSIRIESTILFSVTHMNLVRSGLGEIPAAMHRVSFARRTWRVALGWRVNFVEQRTHPGVFKQRSKRLRWRISLVTCKPIRILNRPILWNMTISFSRICSTFRRITYAVCFLLPSCGWFLSAGFALF